MTVTKKHDIVDARGISVGYTVAGTFGNLIVYLHGNGYDNYMHGETGNFQFYCTQFGWNYSLREILVPDQSKPITDMLYPERVCNAFATVVDEVNTMWDTTSKVPTCSDIQKLMYRALSTYIISHTVDHLAITGYINRVPGQNDLSLIADFAVSFTQQLVSDDIVDIEQGLAGTHSFYYYKSTKVMEFKYTFNFSV